MDAKEARQGRRRGGYADAVAAGPSGALPEAAPVLVGSEAELRAELERLVAQLAPSADWTQRVAALLRLEGLVHGGAARFAAFPELLAAARDALAAQMQERRSAVSRQACHCVGVLAAACGPALEPLALHLLPVVFKTLAMGIHVVSEAADACAHALLAACPSARILPKLCSVVSGDRNARLRQSAADFLLRALECWPPAEVERQLEAVERAVVAAARDAQADTRALGRRMFGAYCRAWPQQGAALLARLEGPGDRQLADKLAAAAQDYVPGLLPDGAFLSQPPSRRSSLGNSGGSGTPPAVARTSSLPSAGVNGGGAVRLAPAVPKLALSALTSTAGSPGSRPASARSAGPAASSSLLQGVAWQQGAATARENQPDNRCHAPPVHATPHSIFPKTLARREAAVAAADGAEGDGEPRRQAPAGGERERLAPRRSVGGAALRMSLASFRRQQEPGDALEESSAPPAAAAVVPLQWSAAQRASLRLPLPPAQADQQQQQQQQQGDAGSRPLTARRGAIQAGSIPEDSEVSSLSSGWEEPAAGAGVSAPASLAPLLASLSRHSVGWGDRVSGYQAIQAALEASGASMASAADVASNSDRLIAALLEGTGDAHFRVAAAALAALGAGLAGPRSHLFEAQLDRVLTALFARVVDPKEQLRCLVASALRAARQQHGGDALVAALARALQANRAPRVKCAVMAFFTEAVRGGSSAGEADGGGGGEAAEQPGRAAAAAPPPLLRQLSGPSSLAGLLRGMLQLATDKNPEVRRAAAEALAAAYRGGEAQAVLAALHSLPPADLLAAQRAIGPAIQQQQQQGQGQGQLEPPAAAIAPLSSRPHGSRHSGEGLRQQQQQPLPPGLPRVDSSGSLTARSRQGSQAGSPAPASQQAAAPPAQAPPTTLVQQQGQQQGQQLTPEPPSPFPWRVQSASPLAPGAAAGVGPGPEAEGASAPAAAPEHAASFVQQQQQEEQGGAASEQRQHAAAATLPAVADLAPFDDAMAAQLGRLLGQLEAGPSSEALQGLSRLAHVLPAAAWQPCFEQVVAAVCGAARPGSPAVLRDAALMLARDLAAAAPPSLFLPSLPALLPCLLACAAELEAREVAMAADEALEELLSRAPPQSCLALLAPRLPSAADQLSVDRQAGAELHAAVASLRRVVGRMQPAGLAAHLQPLLLPGLCAAYRSPLTDVRKATVDCLVAIWLVVGDGIKPHLEPLSASQLKLLQIYCDRARSQAAETQGRLRC